MMPYILHVSVIVIACFSFYKLFLQKETFYQLNRWTLLACLTASFTLPLLPLPFGWNAVDKIVAELREPQSSIDKTESRALKTDAGVSQSKSGVSEKNLYAGATNKPGSGVIDIRSGGNEIVSEGNETIPVVAAPPAMGRINSAPGHEAGSDKEAERGQVSKRQEATTQDANRQVADRELAGNEASGSPGALMILHALFYCYLIGVCFFGARLVLQMAVLCYQACSQPVIRDGGYRIVETSGNRAPCSFVNNIFINPALYDPETYQQILIHEKIHVSGRHTLDILAAEIAVVVQWFNPFIWLYRREVENNLEFLTDQSVLLHRDVEKSAYQLSLLRVSAPHLTFSITNNYNQSLLKRRIVMMNSQRSRRQTVWKYFFLLPLLTVLVITLNKPAALSQPRQPAPAIAGAFIYRDTTVLPASRSADTLPSRPAPVPETIPAPATPTEPASLPDPQPVISLQKEAAMNVDVAPEVHINLDLHTASDSDHWEGSWFVTSRGDNLEFELRAGEDEHSWGADFTVKKSEIDPFPGQGNVSFKVIREAGTMSFKGQFDGQQGFGHFQFQPDPAYFQALKQMGVEDVDNHNGETFFLRNVKKDFVAMLQRNGYMPLSRHNVVSLSAMNIDKAYIDDLRAAGYDHLTAHELISLKSQHIDGQYIRSMAAGKSDSFIPPHELIAYKASGIDSAYLASLRDAGLTNLPLHTLVAFKATGITPEYAKAFHDLGYGDVETPRLVSLKSMGITPDFVQQFHQIGYDHIPYSLLVSLKAMGIDAAYVTKMKEKGFDSQDLRKYMRLKQDFSPDNSFR